MFTAMHVIVSVVLTHCGSRPWRSYCARCGGVSMRGRAGINAFLTACSPVRPVGAAPPCGRVAPLHRKQRLYSCLDNILRTASLASVFTCCKLVLLFPNEGKGHLFMVYFNGNVKINHNVRSGLRLEDCSWVLQDFI